MARATAVEDPIDEAVAHAGDAMMMLVSRSVYEVLDRQSVAEGSSRGAVLSAALSEYVERHGSEDVKRYMALLGGKHAT